MSMETCTEHDHVVVVYDDGGYNRYPCPLCQLLEQKQTLDDRVDSLEGELDDLQLKVEALQTDLDTAENQI